MVCVTSGEQIVTLEEGHYVCFETTGVTTGGDIYLEWDDLEVADQKEILDIQGVINENLRKLACLLATNKEGKIYVNSDVSSTPVRT